MKRRTFIKSLAALTMTPFVNLRSEVDREALMIPFCGESFRYSLAAPFLDGSLTYATDACRIIRAELNSPEITGEGCLPPAAKVFESLFRPARWELMTKPHIGELVRRNGDISGVCPVCLGREVPFGDYYPDRDVIEDLCRRGVRWDVDENSHGDESCPQCRGKEYYGPSVLQIGSERFSYAMLAPIWNLPGEIRVSLNSRPNDPLLFTADGFEGMVMPLRSA